MGRSSKEVSYKIKSPHCCGPSKVFSSRPTKFLPQVNKLFKKHVKFTFSPSELNTDYDILEIRKILESGKCLYIYICMYVCIDVCVCIYIYKRKGMILKGICIKQHFFIMGRKKKEFP